MHTLLQRAVVFFFILFLAACAATIANPDGSAKSGQKISVSSVASKNVFLQLHGSEEITSSTDWSAFLEEWQISMANATGSAGMGFNLLQPTDLTPTDAGTLVKVAVNDFRYMSQAKRYLVGVMAGNAYLDVTVEFFELPSNKYLGMRRYNSSTRGSQGIFSAATPKQVEAISTEIVREVRGDAQER